METGKSTTVTVGEAPLVSVILPIRNEAHYIARSLGRVGAGLPGGSYGSHGG